ncbi:MAG: hypothetical protein HYR71_10535 [Chloroflexi bacterium]|nr:hypothetical protein [Chloroflexota bacterium]MBI3425533.1 hypothetical protein [Acidobacteriota bacterium]
MKRLSLAIPTELKPPIVEKIVETADAPVLPYLQRKLRGFARRRRWLESLRVLSTIYWLGPWRHWAIRYYQWRNQNQPLLSNATTFFTGLDAAQTVAQLETNGFALGLQLPEAEVAALLAYCAQHQAKEYHNHDLNCPALRNIVRDPALLEVARTYLGAEPLLYSTQLYWTHPPAIETEKRRVQKRKARFHYDLGDFKALVIFFYLTDVGPDCGPHITIQGTHQRKSWRQMLSRYLTDQEAQALYGDRIKTITGPHGSGFFADIACYHKHSYGARERLMMSVTYVLQRQPERRVPKTF